MWKSCFVLSEEIVLVVNRKDKAKHFGCILLLFIVCEEFPLSLAINCDVETVPRLLLIPKNIFPLLRVTHFHFSFQLGCTI